MLNHLLGLVPVHDGAAQQTFDAICGCHPLAKPSKIEKKFMKVV